MEANQKVKWTVAEADANQPNDISKFSSFEDLLELVGTRGPWNIFMFCLCGVGVYDRHLVKRVRLLRWNITLKLSVRYRNYFLLWISYVREVFTLLRNDITLQRYSTCRCIYYRTSSWEQLQTIGAAWSSWRRLIGLGTKLSAWLSQIGAYHGYSL